MRASWLLIGLTALSLNAAPRDPFQPLESAVCQTPDRLTRWRLLGVLGREARLHAWLMSPQGGILKVAPAAPLSLSGWLLGTITPRSLTLTTGRGCAPQRITFSLKGSPYAQDDTSAAGERLARARAGQ